MNPNIQRITLAPSQLIRMENVASTAGGGAIQLASANDKRQYLRIENTGLSSIWVGMSNNVTTGPTGLNIGTIATGAVTTLEGFGGDVWGSFTGLSHATVHVVKVFEY